MSDIKKPQIAAQIDEETAIELNTKWPYPVSTLLRALLYKYLNNEIEITNQDIQAASPRK